MILVHTTGSSTFEIRARTMLTSAAGHCRGSVLPDREVDSSIPVDASAMPPSTRFPVILPGSLDASSDPNSPNAVAGDPMASRLRSTPRESRCEDGSHSLSSRSTFPREEDASRSRPSERFLRFAPRRICQTGFVSAIGDRGGREENHSLRDLGRPA